MDLDNHYTFADLSENDDTVNLETQIVIPQTSASSFSPKKQSKIF